MKASEPSKIRSGEIMIGRSELRIGNLFNPDIPTKVEAWMLLPESKVVFEPIPLDEAWLTSLGLMIGDNKICNPNFYFIRISDTRIFMVGKNNGMPILRDDYGECQIGFAWINHVHQLQNLYYALCGHELNDRG